MREPLRDPQPASRYRSPLPDQPDRNRIDPVELARWFRTHRDRLRDRWLSGVVARHDGLNGQVRDLLEEFLALLVPFVPAFLGPYRQQIRPLWRRATELYGSTAAMRGLAAGEVIEEFQLLREEVVRLFYDAPPVRDLDRLALRDVLRVNRIVDLGVTHASVGHTDTLFFAHFRGTGVPQSLTDEQAREIREQLGAIREEFRTVMELLEEQP